MSRSINAIYEEIRGEAITLATAANNQSLIDMLNNTSKVAIWKILFYSVAFGINVLENAFDLLKIIIDELIAQKKPHSARWYAEKAKLYQYGFNLIQQSDEYNNSGLTDTQIAAARIVSHAAVVEQDRGIRIKVAKTVGDALAALNGGELASFTAYMEQVKDAGVKLRITSAVADDLKASLRIFYNPLVLSGTGARIDGTDMQPVQNAFKEYLKNLPFNGLFVPALMVDQLQKVDGVVIVKDDSWMARYGALDYSTIDVEYLPDAGYLRIADQDLSIQFIPHAVI
jgi:hypothetical protein